MLGACAVMLHIYSYGSEAVVLVSKEEMGKGDSCSYRRCAPTIFFSESSSRVLPVDDSNLENAVDASLEIRVRAFLDEEDQ